MAYREVDTSKHRRYDFLAALLLVFAWVSIPPAAAGETYPTFSKVFAPNTIGPGSVSTITFTIDNDSATPVTDLAFTDTLPVVPGPMTIADPANASTDCTLGISGTLSAPDGGSTITLSDAQIGGFSSCTVTVDVTASTPGVHTNPAITLSSSAGSSMSEEAELTVDASLPGFSKSFAPSSISLGEITQGQKLEGTVSKVTLSGAIVDVGAPVRGLLHISDLLRVS